MYIYIYIYIYMYIYIYIYIYAIIQRLFSRSKSAFENAFTYTFLEGLWKWLTARFKEIIVIILLPILGSLSAFLEHCPRIRA